MALATQTRPAPFGAITVLNITTKLESVIAAAQAWNVKRKTRNVLASLSDRELNDIGLSRGDLDNLPSKM